jgi:hypothetical protein
VRFTWQRAAAVLLAFSLSSRAADPSISLPKFTGAASCQSSGCHGGGAGNDQSTTWATLDFHVRATAILLTPRSAGIVAGLRTKEPAAPAAPVNPNCTVCHSPFAQIHATAPARLLPGAHPDEGVSCESCHGAASGWVRSHTRTDYTEAQRIASGMTDLRGGYARANTCVACHEYLSPEIAKAGHPPLVFELDSQTVSEPPHWRESDPWIGLHSWLAGQAVAFREDTWHLLNGAPDSAARWDALGWILQRTAADLKGLPDFSIPTASLSGQELASLESSSDHLARSGSVFPWTKSSATNFLRHLAADGASIGRLTDSQRQLHRAQVLAQAMDRLLVQLHNQKTDFPDAADKLSILFADVNAGALFDAAKFCNDLTAFSGTLGNT